MPRGARGLAGRRGGRPGPGGWKRPGGRAILAESDRSLRRIGDAYRASDVERHRARHLPRGSGCRADSPARGHAEPRQRHVRRAVDRLAPLRRSRLRSRRRQVRRRPPEAPAVAAPDREAEPVGRVALRRGPDVRVDGPGRRPQHPPRDAGPVAPRRGVGAPRNVLQRHPRLPGPRALPPLSDGQRCAPAHPPAERSLLQQAAGRARARREPDVRHERGRVHDPAGLRVVARPDALPRHRRVLHLLQHRVVRHVPARPARRRLWRRVGGAGGPRLAALLGDPPRSRPKGAPRGPGHGPAAAAAATRRAARRLGRAAQLGLGDGPDVRDQLRRLGVQRVRARRELQPDQPPQLLGQLQGRLHLRRQRVQDQPAHPPVQRRRPTSTRRARTASASGGSSAMRSSAPSCGSAAARRTRCRSTT